MPPSVQRIRQSLIINWSAVEVFLESVARKSVCRSS